jgi:hypothetical protein
VTPTDRPLDTQVAAPPPGPPRRPIVGTAMGDDDLSRLRAQAEQLQRGLLALRHRLDSA